MNIDKNYLHDFLHDDILNMGFDEETVDVALDAFIESTEESLPKLVTAIKEENMEDIRFHAHTLKGTYANFDNENFKELSELFKEIEFAAKDKKDMESIKEYFEKIKNLTLDWLKL